MNSTCFVSGIFEVPPFIGQIFPLLILDPFACEKKAGAFRILISVSGRLSDRVEIHNQLAGIGTSRVGLVLASVQVVSDLAGEVVAAALISVPDDGPVEGTLVFGPADLQFERDGELSRVLNLEGELVGRRNASTG